MHYRYSTRNLQTAMQNGVLAAKESGSSPIMTATADHRSVAISLALTPETRRHRPSKPKNISYDGFNGSSTNSALSIRGNSPKAGVKVLEDGGTNPAWVETEYAYDATAGFRQSLSPTTSAYLSPRHTPTILLITYLRSHTLPVPNGVQWPAKNMRTTPKGAGSMKNQRVNTQGEINLAECSYDHKSQLTECNLGRFATTGLHPAPTEPRLIRTMLRGWLKVSTPCSRASTHTTIPDPSSNSGYSVSYTE